MSKKESWMGLQSMLIVWPFCWFQSQVFHCSFSGSQKPVTLLGILLHCWITTVGYNPGSTSKMLLECSQLQTLSLSGLVTDADPSVSGASQVKSQILVTHLGNPQEYNCKCLCHPCTHTHTHPQSSNILMTRFPHLVLSTGSEFPSSFVDRLLSC